MELLLTAGEKWSFYLGPILFYKVMALVDSPRLLVWYERSVCLWCVCGFAVEFPLFSCCSDMKERNALSLLLSIHSWILDGLCVCQRERERKNAVVAALHLMHNSDTIQAHFTRTISTSKTAVRFALYYLSFALFHSTCSLPSGSLFDVIHVMQNWLRCRASMPAAMELS